MFRGRHTSPNTGASIPLDSHDEAVLSEYRRSVLQFGALGFGAGICAGFLATPFLKRFIGKHSNVAVPLGTAALFSMFGSAIAANQHSHSVAYTIFKRQESIRMNASNQAQHFQHYAKRRAERAAQQQQLGDDDR